MKNISPYIKSFKEISEEYEFAYTNIEVKTTYYNRLIAKGMNVPSAGAYYRFTTLTEANEIKQKLKVEIDRKYTLELTGSFEAKLVYYFKYILKRKHRLYKSFENNVSPRVRHGISHLMYHHILAICKKEMQPIDNIAYSNFKDLVEFRNWLAHGRGWNLDPVFKKYDFEYSYLTIEKIISLMPNFPDKLK